MSSIKSYDKSSIENINHPYIENLLKNTPQFYMDNVITDYRILQIGDKIIPISINDTEYNNSFVCSLYGIFIEGNKAYIDSTKLMGRINIAILNFIGKIFKYGKVNKVIIVNNWLFGTNIYNGWSENDIKLITEFLTTNFKDHVILFKSLSDIMNAPKEEWFEGLNYKIVPAMNAYIFDHNNNISSKRDNKNDLALLKNSKYTICKHDDIKEDDYERLCELYTMLYITKYPGLSPTFCPEFFKLIHQTNFIEIIALRNKQGIIDGMTTILKQNQYMMSPFIGYDTSLEKEVGLYRMITAIGINYAEENKLIYHAGTAASKFKRNRGATHVIENSAVYFEHLSNKSQKYFWTIFAKVMQKYAKPFLQKTS